MQKSNILCGLFIRATFKIVINLCHKVWFTQHIYSGHSHTLRSIESWKLVFGLVHTVSELFRVVGAFSSYLVHGMYGGFYLRYVAHIGRYQETGADMGIVERDTQGLCVVNVEVEEGFVDEHCRVEGIWFCDFY